MSLLKAAGGDAEPLVVHRRCATSEMKALVRKFLSKKSKHGWSGCYKRFMRSGVEVSTLEHGAYRSVFCFCFDGSAFVLSGSHRC